MNVPACPLPNGQAGAISRRLVLFLGVPAGLLMLGALALLISNLRSKHRRAEWMERTLPELAMASFTNASVQKEIEQLRVTIRKESLDWTGSKVLLMTNGEALLNAFRHGANNGWPDHLFLARGTDGGWYYSTYHFCNHMAGVSSDDPPGSIATFTNRYAARRFDGKSRECLSHTWP